MQTRFAVLLVALFILGVMVSIPKAHAVCGSGTWNGNAGDGKWETAGNWSGNCVPTDDASIPNDAFVVTISTTQDPFVVVVGTGDTLVCTTTCFLDVGNTVGNLGTIINRGTLEVSPVFDNALGGIFYNFGTIDLRPGSLHNEGVFINFGTILVGPPPSPNPLGEGLFSNTGTFTNECGGTVSEAPTSGSAVLTTQCPVGGEVLSLDYGSLMLSAMPWILVLATFVAATAIILRQKFKLFH